MDICPELAENDASADPTSQAQEPHRTLHSHFAKKIPEPNLHELVDRMVAEKKVLEVNGALEYRL